MTTLYSSMIGVFVLSFFWPALSPLGSIFYLFIFRLVYLYFVFFIMTLPLWGHA